MQRLRLSGLPAAIALGLLGCPASPRPAPPDSAAAAPAFPADADVELVLSSHDSLTAARAGLEQALRQPVDLPLPFPRVERRGDRFVVVGARGRFAALSGLLQQIKAGPGAGPQILARDPGGGDVVRLGIVCTEGTPAALLSAEAGAAPRELSRLAHGQVVVPAEEGAEEGDEGERGLLRVLAPQAGLVREQDVLLPADCTPRDEDNDDGNGRLLAGGRLCLTTRSTSRQGELVRAALVAVAPSYRRCTRFAEAGTFDGFDHDAAGTQFAVEVADERGRPALDVYDVGGAGQLARRARLPGLLRPAYLQGALVAVVDEPAGQGLVAIEPAGLSQAQPRRLLTLAGARFAPAVMTYRPAAPTLREGQVVATFQLSCNKGEEGRVKAAARRDFRQCVLEVETEVSFAGKETRRRCQLNNAPSALEEPLPTPCR